ncbi:MAG: hypothetical protein A3C55_04225 [Gammaproteobacteria bacterium RIFCSPHIGHO2_02_FULL_42_13]|nr:MAG: hypothetical protein A3C55_04225 [Gammaproteobacteria bacterium RIFCSPHIGHO2_02_FULL_42_13]OGT67671.1 MAG: hypothetical protein A3H43_02615 [Gammaproteobacteria bacterium RIFCSPLOWO2_02_FULL_42_9]
MTFDFASLAQILQNLNNELPGLWRFVTAATYLAGFWCAFRAMYELKEYGELRMMMSVHTDMRKPLTELLVAIVLLYWPSLLGAMLKSTFGSPNILAYPGPTNTQYELMFKLAGGIVQFIGFVAFIRGWVLFTHIGSHGGQPGMFGKAVAHVFAGLLAINIFGTWQILETIFGVSNGS